MTQPVLASKIDTGTRIPLSRRSSIAFGITPRTPPVNQCLPFRALLRQNLRLQRFCMGRIPRRVQQTSWARRRPALRAIWPPFLGVHDSVREWHLSFFSNTVETNSTQVVPHSLQPGSLSSMWRSILSPAVGSSLAISSSFHALLPICGVARALQGSAPPS